MLTQSNAELVELIDIAGPMSDIGGRVMREMFFGGHSWAFRAGDQIVAVAGLYPMSIHEAETWFQFAPTARMHLKGLARLSRLTLQGYPYRRIICLCTSSEGARFARLVGFEHAGPHPYGDLWHWSGE